MKHFIARRHLRRSPAWPSLLFTATLGAVLFGPFAVTDARAEVYSVQIQVSDVEELEELLDSGDIDEDDFDRLSRLLDQPIDLNTASRDALFELPGLSAPMIETILEYRAKYGDFVDQSDLQALGIPRSVVMQLRTFTYVGTPPDPESEPFPVKGTASFGIMSPLAGDARPAMLLQTRMTIANWVEIGLTGIIQDRIGSLNYHEDPGLTYYSAEARAIRLEIPKFFALVDQPEWQIIAGTYQVGFAEGLVFDEADRQRANGFYADYSVSLRRPRGYGDDPDKTLGADYGNIDIGYPASQYGSRERLMGLGARLKPYRLGDAGTIEAALWFSWWAYDAFQNDVDSHDRDQDKNDSVYKSAPSPIYCIEGAAGYEQGCAKDGTGRLSAESMRAAYSETILGGRVAYAPINALRIGFTGYYSWLDWLVSDDLHFAPSSAYPDRDEVGTMGFDIEARFANVILTGEYAHTLTGGHGAILRSTFGFKGVDLEIQGRYLGQGFDNPHASARSQGDEYLGQRDRDEIGGRVVADIFPAKWIVGRVTGDVWYRPSLDRWNLEATARLHVDIFEFLSVAGGLTYTDKDLTEGGRDEEYDDDTLAGEVDDFGASQRDPGAGMKLRAFARLRLKADEWARFEVGYTSTIYDVTVSPNSTAGYPDDLSAVYDNGFAHDHHLSLGMTFWPHPDVALRLFGVYQDVESQFAYRGEQYIQGKFGVRWKIMKGLTAHVDYQARGYIDERKSIRDDYGAKYNPEHELRGRISYRF